MGMPHFLLLSSVGLFISAQAQDCSRPLGGPNMDLRTDDILKPTFSDGSRAKFVCDFGYTTASGTGFVTCTAGIWSPVTLECTRKTCEALQVLNGQVSYPNGNQHGDEAIITCNLGFRIVGKNTRTCNNSGWTGRTPECEVIKCNKPGKISNGTFSPMEDIYVYANVITYKCDDGLTLVGLASRTCKENEQFQPGPPECKDVRCADPEIENGFLTGGSRPPHRYRATVMIACKPGYNLKGQATVVCGINSNWTPELPNCEAVTCQPPSSVIHGSFSPNKPIYQFGEVVEYSCDKDYEMKGQKTVSCSGSGAFKPATPVCTQKQTTPRPTTTTTTASATPPKINPESGASDVKTTVIIVVVVLLVVVVVVVIFVIYRRRARRESNRWSRHVPA